MRLLAIETSCDETAAAVVEDGRRILSNVVATQSAVHAPYGGVVPELASPFGAFLMCQTLRSFPRELLDAARIDGAGEWTVFVRVVVPIAAPAMAVLAVLHFQYLWNSFVWPLTVTSEDAMRTLPVGLANLQTVQSTNFPLLMAGSTFAAIPMIIVFFVAQRFFLKGLTVGAVRG